MASADVAIVIPPPIMATTAPTPVSLMTSTRSLRRKENRIQVSSTKKPLFFYVNLAKKYMQQYNEVELCALGMAITRVVTVAEILKNSGFALQKKVAISLIDRKDETKDRTFQKAKIEIVLGKTEKLDSHMSSTNTRVARATETGLPKGAALSQPVKKHQRKPSR